MRHGTAGRRSRNRGNGGRRGNQGKTQVFDSNGPDVRIRGTAHQVFEKYVGLAKDASGSGDHILAESYLQYAEHYQRVISGWHETVDEHHFGNGGQEEQEDRYSTRKERPQRRKYQPDGNQQEKTQEDDLGLPSSILGVDKNEENAEKTNKSRELEDAE